MNHFSDDKSEECLEFPIEFLYFFNKEILKDLSLYIRIRREF